MDDSIEYTTSSDLDPQELLGFYQRQRHTLTNDRDKLERMIAQTQCFVAARRAGELVGIARGVTDGVHGYLAECKLDPSLQGPACVTRIEGRIEHDSAGVAREMALRVVEALKKCGVERIQALAYGTEVDFCEELGFKRAGGMVAMELRVES